MTISLPVRQRTPEWLEARKHGIGASEAAAAIGLSEWQSPIGLWAEKLGLVPPVAETPSMRIGSALEPLIAAMYTEATGVKVRRANNLRQHPEHTWMLASIDRRAGRRPVELKFSARATGYGEPGTDEVPDHVLVQVLHQLAVLDEPEGDVVLLKPGALAVAIYTIRREAVAEAAIIEREAVFWEHVVSRTEPDVDGSEATARALAALYPRGTELVTVEADEVANQAMRILRKVRGEQAASEAERAELEARIKAAMLAAGAERITAAGVGEITWRPTKPREVIDWEAVAGAYRGLLEADSFDVERIEGIVAENTHLRESAPRFGPPKWEGAE
ncbi:MAG: YqaJ viral recombinase family protein [Chloroflexota bacterium]